MELEAATGTRRTVRLDERSRELRRTIVRMLEAAGRGHLASALSLVEILRVLYDNVLRHDAKQPSWVNRDRFILSKGHGCLALYAILAEKGFFAESELWRSCRSDGLLGGHPEIHVPGVEASTGSLGHGLSIGIGMALAARLRGLSYRTFVLVGDGECNEGSVWEGMLCAAKHRLEQLTVLVDSNKLQSYGSTAEVLSMEPFCDKWRAFGGAVCEVDGHDTGALQEAFQALPLAPDRPSVLICHTVKGGGIPFTENDLTWHHKSRVSDDEVRALLAALEG